jgi:acetyl-CoA carboxylase biotin carboxyl carrier protein
MSGTTAEELRVLHAEASALVLDLPGPLRRISVRTGEHSVEIEWPDVEATPRPPAPPSGPSAPPSAPPSVTSATADGATIRESTAPDEDAYVVRAPLVGTFYPAPQPGAQPFVAVGDLVEAGQTLAIVEAMKLMNHISAERAGRIAEIVVGSGDPVEYEQPLMRVVPIDGMETP